MGNSVKANLIQATIGAKKEFKRTSLEYGDETFEFIQPSLKERKEIIKRVRGKDGNVDEIGLMVEAIIALTVVPGTNERVFDESHRDSMMDQPAGGFVDIFAEKALSMLTGVEEDSGNPKS